MKNPLSALAVLSLSLATLPAQQDFVPNYDESKIPPYTLPDPLTSDSGEKVTSAAQWEESRRGEIFEMFASQMFGKNPVPAEKIPAELLESSDDALDGKARREQWKLTIPGKEGSLSIHVLCYWPKKPAGDEKIPFFIGLNFQGNHTVNADPDIVEFQLPPILLEHDRAPADRGAKAERWNAELIVSRGYGLVTACYHEIDPDVDDGFQNGIHALFPEERTPESWGSIAGWSFALSRILDFLETHSLADPARAAVIGHSRLGKTSLWAGASDPRFALVISNNSGCGGAALSKRRIGETVGRITTAFPHWFCGNFRQYANHEELLPFDQHELLALIAPRPLYAASATEDQWADPKGEFLGLLHAVPVYELYGKDPLGVTEQPAPDTPVGNLLGYHLRTGKHDVTKYDWEQYLNFADKWLKKP